MKLRIDPEFEEKIPPLTKEEFQQLENNILSDGVVINPIIIWNGVIVDGHNRFHIVEKHPEIKFTTHEKTFESRCDAIVWICMNQLGRRNLSSGQKKYLLGKMYEARKTVQGSNNQYVQAKSENYQNDSFHSTDVAAQIAKEQNVGYATVHRAASFAKAVDIADEIEPGIRSDVLSGDFKPTERELREIIRAGPDERPAIVERIRKHTPKDKATPPQRKVSNLEMDLVHQIGNEMLEARSNGNPETMLYEMNDALGSLTFRWNFCYENYRSFFEDDNYRERINRIIQKGLKYMKDCEGGKFAHETD